MAPPPSKRRRAWFFALWFLLPPLTVAVAHRTALACGRRLEDRSAWRRTLLRLIPDMTARLEGARATAGRFAARPEPGADLIETLGARMNRTAQQCAFRMDSLRVERIESGEDLNALRVTLHGGGTAAALVRFLDAMQTSEPLMVVDTARVGVTEDETERCYNADLVFRCYLSPM